MSGHSKWSTIKRQKGIADVKRGAIFTKLAKAIIVAVKQGGGVGNPDQNFRLRLAVDAARASNMPKENISRAIERASGKQGESYDEAVYEGFGPCGIVVIVEAATDNKNRTSSEIKTVFEKNGGAMGQPGSVSYLFKQVGEIIIDKQSKSYDEIFLDVADSGGEDVEEEDGEAIIYTSTSTLSKVRDYLLSKGYTIKQAEIIRKPISFVEISDEMQSEKIVNFLDKLEELDDVQKTYTNVSLKLDK